MTTEELPSAPHTILDWFRGYEEEGKLRGFRCPNCGLVTATWGLACARCGKADRTEIELGNQGSVVAFTILAVPGEDFLNDAPYAYVVVELEGGGRVTGWMPTIRDTDHLTIGDKVRFVPSYKPGVQFVRDGAEAPPG